MTNADTLRLERENCLFTLVDWQERLAAAMPPEQCLEGEANAKRLVEGAGILDIPVVTTEQYPRGLGPTVEPLRQLLPSTPIEKTAFACTAVPAYLERLREGQRRQIVVFGMETHVCIYQTVRQLGGLGYTVHVPVDAVLSRTATNRKVGLDLCQRAGAILTSTETVLFDLLGRAGGDAFKAISRLVR